MTRLGPKLALAAGSLALVTVLVETCLQAVVPVVRPRLTRIDPVLGWSHYPLVSRWQELEGHRYRVSYNSHGFRVPEHAFKKPEGTLRVVVLGDSYTDGSEVGDEATFTWRLQERLSNVEVINLGVYGYSTVQELLTLERLGLRYQPDLVLLMTIANDYSDNHVNASAFGPKPRVVLSGNSIELEGPGHWAAQAAFGVSHLPLPGQKMVHRHSHLYYGLNRYIYQRLAAGRITALLESQEPHYEVADQTYRQLVLRMHQRSAAAGAELMVVFAYQRRELVEHNNPAHRRHQVNAQALAVAGVRVADLYDGLLGAERAAAGSLYYRENIHWNSAGHEVVAQLLAEQIEAWRVGINQPLQAGQ